MSSSRLAPSSPIGTILEQARKELLDLGLRNTLLNYRPPKTRGIEVARGHSADIFNCLAVEKRSMEFLPQPEPGAKELRPAPSPARPAAVALQTNLTESSLKTRLLATHLAAIRMGGS